MLCLLSDESEVLLMASGSHTTVSGSDALAEIPSQANRFSHTMSLSTLSSLSLTDHKPSYSQRKYFSIVLSI